ncbi:hypothetical protein BC749_10970 [Flavobacterium araucananum]|uniref:AAA domain-containing protein n=1 Tax=Flavobacterium araucananum TaxID=946678 RepID=A0A227P5A6_9FLAO|nr:ATP-binding protein [Flavobacterium araucananum]OXG05079.1 hypothetical protein B0A64_13690 [Flavobacterium araucananum]PWJ96793.1 hypothetical protein BC749_10970 [Flavobacterium araucananum]
MSNFKLIAIRALNGCDKNFRKNLQEGEFYKFYNQYEFLNDSKKPLKKGETVVEVISKEDHQSDLYYVETLDKREIALNISAVAGRNGSGKSTLAELFFAAIYIFSLRTKIMNHNTDNLNYQLEELEKERKKLSTESPGQSINEEIQKLLKNDKEKLPNFEFLKSRFLAYEEERRLYDDKKQALNDKEFQINSELKEIQRVSSQLKAEIIFQASHTIFSLVVNDKLNNGFEISLVGSVGEETDPAVKTVIRQIKIGKIFDINVLISKLFFYTIAINYSNYSLNSNVIGGWITSLFHKNDGYKTPVVINPMRTDGRFDVNEENHFAKYRLLSNLLSSCKQSTDGKDLPLTEIQFVKSIHFRLNEKKIEKYRIVDTGNFLKGKDVELELINQVYEQFIPGQKIGTIRTDLDEGIFTLISNYLLQKMVKICKTYDGFVYPTSIKEAGVLAEKIKEDDTHITFKIRQAIHFIIHTYDRKGSPKNFLDSDNKLVESVVFSPKELLEWMESPDYGDIINHLPSSMFLIDIELKSKTGEPSFFDLMSSGEQQFIHVVQSVVYHIINLQSISNSEERLSYTAVNILFDEVELYFHPDLQRKFINELRNSIGNLYLKGKGGISSINILFLTHSPFILSDIPSSNVLLLDRDAEGKTIVKENESETFAANINDLLADNFFMDDTLIGAFAEKKIELLIQKIKEEKYKKDVDGVLVDLIGDQYLKASILNFIENHD